MQVDANFRSDFKFNMGVLQFMDQNYKNPIKLKEVSQQTINNARDLIISLEVEGKVQPDTIFIDSGTKIIMVWSVSGYNFKVMFENDIIAIFDVTQSEILEVIPHKGDKS